MDTIKFTPSNALSYNPNDNIYWEKAALRKELDRTFEICNSCRMCFKYCDTFPLLFNLIDKENKNITDFTDKDIERIADKCFQCKICYFKCPYTKDDGHEFNLDFPRLIMRYQAIKAKQKGLGIRDKILGNPDLLGTVGCSTAGLANWANNLKIGRYFMEKLGGINRDKSLPSFAAEKFLTWFAENKHQYTVEKNQAVDRVVLFYTCFGNFNNPKLPRETVYVLWKNKIHIQVPNTNCCGMPALESGNIKFALKQARQNFDSLFPLVRDGYKVVVLNPTCSLTMKEEYPLLLSKHHSAADLAIFSKGIFDINEYLFTLKREDKINRDFKSCPGKVAYHIPCHYRAQNIGYRSRDMMKTVKGTSFVLVDECCGHNGTWAMKRENFADSMRIGSKAFEKIKENEHDIVASDCPLAAVQLKQGTGEDVLHPVQVLAKAYRGEEF